MARPELGTKRVCPTTGRKFYDLNRDPIVSPYTGEVLARAVFEPVPSPPTRAASESDEEETDLVTAGPETVSLEDAAAEEEGAGADDEAALADDEEGGATDDDAFLEEEEEGGDVSDLIDSDLEDDEEG